MATTMASVPSDFPRNCHGSKRCQECPILTSLHRSLRMSECLRIAQTPLNTSNIHFPFLLTQFVGKEYPPAVNNTTLAIVNEYSYRSCVLQYLRHVLLFTCPLLPGYPNSAPNTALNERHKETDISGKNLSQKGHCQKN